MTTRLKVCKFGGSSLATAEQIEKVLAIVKADPARRIVVVSAPGTRFSGDDKVTDLLIQAGQHKPSSSRVGALINAITERFVAIADHWAMGPEVEKLVRRELEHRLRRTGDMHPTRRMDLIKSTGEDLNAQLVARIGQKVGLDTHYVSPKKAGLILTDEPGNAQPLPASYARVKKALDKVPGRVVFPGFFGHTKDGGVITFSRGGSDVTGSVLARAVDAPVYENWTDVDCIYSANPKVVKNPHAITAITFQEMRELAYAGFGVLHDEALIPLSGGVTTVVLKNTNNPRARGTRIVPTRRFDHKVPVVGVAGMSGFSIFFMEKILMNREVGFGRRVLQVFEEEGISFEHMPSGIDSVSLIVKSAQLSPALSKRLLSRLSKELKMDRVDVQHGTSLVVVAGLGMRHTVGLAARATTALSRAKVNLHMINQGASEISLMFGIDERDESTAIRALHAEFFDA